MFHKCCKDGRANTICFKYSVGLGQKHTFINQKFLPLDKLINQTEGILDYKGNLWHIPAERLSQSWRC